MNAHCLLFPPAADLWRLPPEVLFDTSLFPRKRNCIPLKKGWKLTVDLRAKWLQIQIFVGLL
jgi:hypothetical protein